MIDGIHLARVADVIAEATGNDDYDVAADLAAGALARCPELAVPLERWRNGTAQAADISAVVVAATAATAEPLKGYARWIADEVGTEHPTVLTLVEELMREQERGVLDHLAAEQFRKAALDALAAARDMRDAGILGWYCGAMIIGVPAALPGDAPASLEA